MQNLICIICPVGCSLEVSESADGFSVTGNHCPRGAAYAIEEIRSPKRTVTATCEIEGEAENTVKRIPVKTSAPCPREKISALLNDIYKTKIALPVKIGDVIIADWNGEGIDVVATRSFS